MKLKIALLALGVLSLPLMALGAGTPTKGASNMMNPGLWEETVRMEMAGAPMQLPAHTYRHCVTKEDVARFKGVPAPRTADGMTCAMKKFDWSGNTVNYRMVCKGKGGNMQMDGTTTFESHDAYHGTMHMTGKQQGQAVDMTTSVEAKRIGDCSK